MLPVWATNRSTWLVSMAVSTTTTSDPLLQRHSTRDDEPSPRNSSHPLSKRDSISGDRRGWCLSRPARAAPSGLFGTGSRQPVTVPSPETSWGVSTSTRSIPRPKWAGSSGQAQASPFHGCSQEPQSASERLHNCCARLGFDAYAAASATSHRAKYRPPRPANSPLVAAQTVVATPSANES